MWQSLLLAIKGFPLKPLLTKVKVPLPRQVDVTTVKIVPHVKSLTGKINNNFCRTVL